MANLTLLEWAMRTDPNGTVPIIANLLSQTNEILTDMVVKEGNLPTGERVTIATGLPTIYYRALNQGIPTSKATTAQVDENVAIAEARSEVDIDLAMLNGNSAEFRLSEARMFLEGMNQKIATGLFYGNPASDPKEFLGFSQRYSSLAAGNAQNIIDGGGTIANGQTSMWLVGWGDNTVYAPFPKGSKAGLLQEDLGRQTVFSGSTNLRLEVLAERFQWKVGLVVKDWRAVVRICNLETADFAGLDNELDPKTVGAYDDIIHMMARALSRIPKGVQAMTRLVFYMNASTFSVLMRSALEKSNNAVTVQAGLDQFGRPNQMLSFLGVPIRQCDAILNTEARVT